MSKSTEMPPSSNPFVHPASAAARLVYTAIPGTKVSSGRASSISRRSPNTLFALTCIASSFTPISGSATNAQDSPRSASAAVVPGVFLVHLLRALIEPPRQRLASTARQRRDADVVARARDDRLHLRSEKLEALRPRALLVQDALNRFGELHGVDAVVGKELGVLERARLVANQELPHLLPALVLHRARAEVDLPVDRQVDDLPGRARGSALGRRARGRRRRVRGRLRDRARRGKSPPARARRPAAPEEGRAIARAVRRRAKRVRAAETLRLRGGDVRRRRDGSGHGNERHDVQRVRGEWRRRRDKADDDLCGRRRPRRTTGADPFQSVT
eukprot:29120-Pelagococcus_subviridis.AAC.26